ncbi:MAG: hypothetical protein JWL77_1344 [Chthonomonadaceae bacterium]|nr:hypothetical protein [Chthonomonadaceae bacterium]
MNRKTFLRICSAALNLVFLFGALGTAKADPPLPGAVFTTDSTGAVVNQNLYATKPDVYLDGGPGPNAPPNAASLPPGDYYVQVTIPSGAVVLGTSLGTINERPFHVDATGVVTLIQLTAVLRDPINGGMGYADTTNNGGEYKVWVSTEASFTNNSTKTDNFKVLFSTPPPQPPTGPLSIQKFYDSNMDGIPNDSITGTPIFIEGWQVHIVGATDPILDSGGNVVTPSLPVDQYVLTSFADAAYPNGTYTITESTPNETNWVHTYSTFTDATVGNPANGVPTLATSVTVKVTSSGATVLFGNFCTDGGGGLTLGYWSNTNGQNSMTTSARGMTGLLLDLSGLNLRNGAGANFDPASYNSNPASTAFRPWLLSATATNMAYMLSAQMSAMYLNVNAQRTLNGVTGIFDKGGVQVGGVNGSGLIFVGGGYGNAFGFMTVNQLLGLANSSLGANGYTVAASPTRTYQELLKTALDNGNNNRNVFIGSNPCPFTFPPVP